MTCAVAWANGLDGWPLHSSTFKVDFTLFDFIVGRPPRQLYVTDLYRVDLSFYPLIRQLITPRL